MGITVDSKYWDKVVTKYHEICIELGLNKKVTKEQLEEKIADKEDYIEILKTAEYSGLLNKTQINTLITNMADEIANFHTQEMIKEYGKEDEREDGSNKLNDRLADDYYVTVSNEELEAFLGGLADKAVTYIPNRLNYTPESPKKFERKIRAFYTRKAVKRVLLEEVENAKIKDSKKVSDVLLKCGDKIINSHLHTLARDLEVEVIKGKKVVSDSKMVLNGFDITDLVEKLGESIVQLEFVPKTDGGSKVRNMVATRDVEKAKKFGVTDKVTKYMEDVTTEEVLRGIIDTGLVPVIDLENLGYRTFRVERLLSYTVDGVTERANTTVVENVDKNLLNDKDLDEVMAKAERTKWLEEEKKRIQREQLEKAEKFKEKMDKIAEEKRRNAEVNSQLELAEQGETDELKIQARLAVGNEILSKALTKINETGGYVAQDDTIYVKIKDTFDKFIHQLQSKFKGKDLPIEYKYQDNLRLLLVSYGDKHDIVYVNPRFIFNGYSYVNYADKLDVVHFGKGKVINTLTTKFDLLMDDIFKKLAVEVTNSKKVITVDVVPKENDRLRLTRALEITNLSKEKVKETGLKVKLIDKPSVAYLKVQGKHGEFVVTPDGILNTTTNTVIYKRELVTTTLKDFTTFTHGVLAVANHQSLEKVIGLTKEEFTLLANILIQSYDLRVKKLKGIGI